MRKPLLLAAAAAVAIGAAPRAQAFSLSSVQSLLDGLGVNVTLPEVNVTLPPRAEEAVDNALSHVGTVLDGIDLDLSSITIPQVTIPEINIPEINLPEITVPQVTVPSVDVNQIIEDALSNANTARSDALAKAQTAIDDALSHAQSVLAGISIPQVTIPEISIPQVTIPEVTIPQVTIPEVSIPNVTVPDVNAILDDVLGGIDVPIPSVTTPNITTPDIDGIVSDALARADAEVAAALDRASGVLETVLSDGQLESTLGGVLDNLPPVAYEAVSSALGSLSFISLPNQAAVAVPEPAALALVGCGLAVAGARRRR